MGKGKKIGIGFGIMVVAFLVFVIMVSMTYEPARYPLDGIYTFTIYLDGPSGTVADQDQIDGFLRIFEHKIENTHLGMNGIIEGVNVSFEATKLSSPECYGVGEFRPPPPPGGTPDYIIANIECSRDVKGIMESQRIVDGTFELRSGELECVWNGFECVWEEYVENS